MPEQSVQPTYRRRHLRVTTLLKAAVFAVVVALLLYGAGWLVEQGLQTANIFGDSARPAQHPIPGNTAQNP